MNRHYLLYAHRLLCAVLLLFTSLASLWAREVTERETLCMMCPMAWMEGKGVAVKTQSGETIYFSGETDVTTISGYTIYRTTEEDPSYRSTRDYLRKNMPTWDFMTGLKGKTLTVDGVTFTAGD